MIATNKSRKVVRPAPRLGAWAQTATTWKSKELVLTHRAKGPAIGLRARCASNLSPDVRAGGYWRPAGQTSASRAGRTDWLDPRICLSRKGTGIRFKLKFCVSVADAFDERTNYGHTFVFTHLRASMWLWKKMVPCRSIYLECDHGIRAQKLDVVPAHSRHGRPV